MKLSALAVLAALCLVTPAAAFELPKFELPAVFANFHWDPKAPDPAACAASHSADYCAAVFGGSIYSGTQTVPACPKKDE